MHEAGASGSHALHAVLSASKQRVFPNRRVLLHNLEGPISTTLLLLLKTYSYQDRVVWASSACRPGSSLGGGWEYGLMIEHLPTMLEILDSIPSTTKESGRRRRKKR
jgi:hypothetical protein